MAKRKVFGSAAGVGAWNAAPGLLFADLDPSRLRRSQMSPRDARALRTAPLDTPTDLKRVLDNDADFVTPLDMLAELRDDNKQLAASLRETHGVCDEHGDLVSASLIENWIDEAERRTWFLFEATRSGEPG
jgi:hypothetical protein